MINKIKATLPEKAITSITENAYLPTVEVGIFPLEQYLYDQISMTQ
jgi:hypothetical protein